MLETGNGPVTKWPPLGNRADHKMAAGHKMALRQTVVRWWEVPNHVSS